MYAGVGGHLAVMKYLETKGADLQSRDNFGRTTFMLASGRGHLAVVQYIKEQGIDVNLPSLAGCTAVINACEHGHLEVVRYLRALKLKRKKEKEEALEKSEEGVMEKEREVVFKKKDTFKKMKESAREQVNMIFGSDKRREAALKMAKGAEAKKVADGKAAFKNAVKLSKAKKANKKLLLKEKVGTMVFLKAVKVSKDKQAKDQALTNTSVIISLTPTIKQELADVVSSTLLILAIRIPSDVVLSAMQELFVYTWDELSAQSILNTELSAAFRSILLTGLKARPLLLDYMNTALYMDAAFNIYSQSATPIPLDALIVHALNKM